MLESQPLHHEVLHGMGWLVLDEAGLYADVFCKRQPTQPFFGTIRSALPSVKSIR